MPPSWGIWGIWGIDSQLYMEHREMRTKRSLWSDQERAEVIPQIPQIPQERDVLAGQHTYQSRMRSPKASSLIPHSSAHLAPHPWTPAHR